MWNIWLALLFMAMGGFIVHIAWCAAWKMYKNGKAEGRDMMQPVAQINSRTVR